MAPKMTTGEKIRFFREAKGWTQKTLATKLGQHYKSVEGWERGLFIPKYEARSALAKVFGVDITALDADERERAVAS